MLNKKEKIDKILERFNNLDITAYQLSKETGLNESGLNRFLKGDVDNPHTSTINVLYDHLYSNNTATSTNIYLEKDGVRFSIEEISNFVTRNDTEFLKDSVFKLWAKEHYNKMLVKFLKENNIKVVHEQE